MFSLDGTRLYTSSTADPFVRVWDAETLEPAGRPMRSQLLAVHCMTRSPEGRRLVTGGGGGDVTIWDIERNRELATFTHRTGGRIERLVFASDDILIGTTADGDWDVWRAPAWQQIDLRALRKENDPGAP